jgi:hypothetical protein
MKANPRKFWSMLKQGSNDDLGIPTQQFADFNKDQFYNKLKAKDEYKPLKDPTKEYITQAELQGVLKHQYKATKSRGNSLLPPQLLKFLGTAGIGCLATLLNESAIASAPP